MADLKKASKITVVGTCLAGLVLVAIFLGSPKEGKTMDLTESSVAPKAAIPLVDASAPTTTETATFALG